MDKIIIDRLEVFARHGVFQSEKTLGQKFFISVEMNLDLRQAGMTDNLEKTVNYADVCNGIINISETFDLIETFAEKIADDILQQNQTVKSVKVRVEKPSAPIKHSLKTVAVEITRKRAKIYLGLGSNIGNSEKNLNSAVAEISTKSINIIARSSYYKTKPISDIPQGDYVNCVLEAETTMTPKELIKCLLKIEAKLGRERKERWGPRIIDIDVLTYDHDISDDADIILPHPRMHERLFVLVPFFEINPNYVHPLLNKRIVELKAKLEENQTL
ncbi:MAG: 2-amino-4-hydroxy-6-hydroxymethyldihydropteridine diphosphokinase [Defluviitaleaceae bacterium]|nr:2-amino-4-hydroxy-6-hydroxymethyldihydropteridine diphosphokinase [Defluviitaleaceae bacterium]